MADDQRHGRIFGVLFIVTFLTSIPAYLIFESVLDDPAGFIGGDGRMGRLYFAILLEFFLVLSNVGTGVVLYPIARRQNEGPGHRLRRGSNHRVRLHRGRDHLRARARDYAPGRFPDAADIAASLRSSRTGRSCSAPDSSFRSETG